LDIARITQGAETKGLVARSALAVGCGERDGSYGNLRLHPLIEASSATINRLMTDRQQPRRFGKASMTQFLLLRQAWQMTEHLSGATALQSVPSLWGSDIDEGAFRGLTGTDAQVETLVGGPRSPGFTHRVNGHHERLKTGESDGRRPRNVAP
jgi:hypothetical protein